jgi:hypothetical protein
MLSVNIRESENHVNLITLRYHVINFFFLTASHTCVLIRRDFDGNSIFYETSTKNMQIEGLKIRIADVLKNLLILHRKYIVTKK